MKHFYVDLKKLLAKVGQEQLFKFELNLDPFLLGEETVKFKEPVAVNFVLRNVGEGILIEGQVKAVLVLQCSRCLTLFSWLLITKVRELAVVNKKEKDDVFVIENGKIDLALIIYENLILELPVKRLCRSDCAGLCSVCGKNLNEEPHTHKKEVFDERLAKLKDFFKKS